MISFRIHTSLVVDEGSNPRLRKPFLMIRKEYCFFSLFRVPSLGTFCGVFRRQALDKGADILGVDHIVTGHNADDVAETVLMNGEWPTFTLTPTQHKDAELQEFWSNKSYAAI